MLGEPDVAAPDAYRGRPAEVRRGRPFAIVRGNLERAIGVAGRPRARALGAVLVVSWIWSVPILVALLLC